RLLAFGQGACNGLQIDLCFAAAGSTIQQAHLEFPQRNGLQRLGLLGVQWYRLLAHYYWVWGGRRNSLSPRDQPCRQEGFSGRQGNLKGLEITPAQIRTLLQGRQKGCLTRGPLEAATWQTFALCREMKNGFRAQSGRFALAQKCGKSGM